MPEAQPCPSRFTVTQLMTGDLPEVERVVIEGHVAGCARCQAHLSAQKALADSYLADEEAHVLALRQRLQAEAPPPERSRRFTLPIAALSSFALVGALAALALLFWPAASPPAALKGVRGVMAAKVFALRGGVQSQLAPRDVLAAGDSLRFVVDTAGPGFVSVFSIDGTGALSPFYPDSDPAADPAPLEVERGGSHELPGAIALDDAQGPERLIIVYSPKWFSRAQIHARAHTLLTSAADTAGDINPEALGLEAGARVRTLVVQKAPR